MSVCIKKSNGVDPSTVAPTAAAEATPPAFLQICQNFAVSNFSAQLHISTRLHGRIGPVRCPFDSPRWELSNAVEIDDIGATPPARQRENRTPPRRRRPTSGHKKWHKSLKKKNYKNRLVTFLEGTYVYIISMVIFCFDEKMILRRGF